LRGEKRERRERREREREREREFSIKVKNEGGSKNFEQEFTEVESSIFFRKKQKRAREGVYVRKREEKKARPQTAKLQKLAGPIGRCFLQIFIFTVIQQILPEGEKHIAIGRCSKHNK